MPAPPPEEDLGVLEEVTLGTAEEGVQFHIFSLGQADSMLVITLAPLRPKGRRAGTAGATAYTYGMRSSPSRGAARSATCVQIMDAEVLEIATGPTL